MPEKLLLVDRHFQAPSTLAYYYGHTDGVRPIIFVQKSNTILTHKVII